MKREEIIYKVNDILSHRKQYQDIKKEFLPFIEEFFVRLVDQFDLSDSELENKIIAFSETSRMSFEKLGKNSGGVNKYTVCDENTTHKIDSFSNCILINVEFLKMFLKGNTDIYNNFIEAVFHELGHSIQVEVKDNIFYSGLEKNEYTDGPINKSSRMTNECCEVLNTKFLISGSSKQNTFGYTDMMKIGEAFFTSLGFTNKEIARLQWEENAREKFETIVKERVGNDYKGYLTATETSLDTICNLISELGFEKELYHRDLLKKNLQTQIRGFNMLTNCMIQKRILNSNKDLYLLAKIGFDKSRRDVIIKDAITTNFDEFMKNESIDLNEGYNINILEQEIGQERKKEYKQVETKFAEELMHKITLESEIKYDNSDLIKNIETMVKEIDLRKFPSKEKRELYICKFIGKINKFKSKFLNKNNKMISEKANINEEIENKNMDINIADKMKSFKDNLSTEKQVIVNNGVLNNKNDIIEKGREEDENVR